MVRLQVQLTDAQIAALRRSARAREMSVASIVREAVDRHLAAEGVDDAWARALSVVGRYRGGTENVSVEHDAYLDEAYLPPHP